jgi:aspartate aminotransferase-like enzyme
MTGIESSIASTVRPGDRALVLVHGRFGERIVDMLHRWGASVIVCSVAWGETIGADHLRRTLTGHPPFDHVWMVHSETSTGVLTSIEDLLPLVRIHSPSALIGVDAVTSIGIHPVFVDAWGLDLVAAGIQKGLMCPPGLAVVAISERAQSRMHEQPRAYTLHLPTVLQQQVKGLFAWTPPVTLVRGLGAALDRIHTEGVSEVWGRHARVSQYLRESLIERGFSLFGAATSNALVAIADERSERIRELLRMEHDIIVAGGQDRMSGQLLRIGCCGATTMRDISELMTAVDAVLKELS